MFTSYRIGDIQPGAARVDSEAHVAQARQAVEALASQARTAVEASGAPEERRREGWGALGDALEAGDLATARALLHEKPHLARAQGPQGATALMWAACHGRLDCVLELLPSSDALAVDDLGRSALMCAASAGHVDCVRALLRSGGARLIDNEGRSPIRLARDAEQAACADALALASSAVETYEAFAHFGSDGMPDWAAQMSPLRSAVELDLPEALSAFLALPGAAQKAQARAADGLTPLMLAAREGRAACVRALVPHSVVDARVLEDIRLDALMIAASAGAAACVEALLPHADPSARDEQGRTALMHAALAGSVECVLLLRSPERCADVDCGDCTALFLAAAEPASTGPLIESLLPQSDVNAGAEGWLGSTPLMAAIKAGNRAAIEVLAPVSDASAEDSHGGTAITLAVDEGGAEVVAFLAGLSDWRGREGRGADPRPLCHAAAANRPDIIRILLPRCDARAVDSDGRDPLLCVIESFNTDRWSRCFDPSDPAAAAALACARELVAHSDPIARDARGLCAMDLAVDSQHMLLADFLAPYSPPEATAAAFAVFGKEGMPQWAAQLEAEELARDIGLVATLPEPTSEAPGAPARCPSRRL